MGHGDFNRQWAGFADDPRRNHGGHGPGGWADWSGWGRSGWSTPGGPGRHGGQPGPPPWVAGLFGLMQPEQQRRGPRVRRGDVRSAILSVLADAQEPVNGYQVIQQITDRSNGEWKPSPGSVYPTIQQLEDEGLVAADDDRGRRSLTLTDEGRAYVADRADELAAVWAPFERRQSRSRGQYGDLKPEIGQVMSAVWQIVTTGSEQQKRAAVEVLIETRRRLYGILADGDDADPEEEQ